MDDDQRRQDQLTLLWKVLDRKDLTRQQRVLFLDMRLALATRGAILSDVQEKWLQSELAKPAPDPDKSEAVQVPNPWRPMSPITIGLWVASAVLALIVCHFCLTFLLHWLGWR